MGEIEAIKFFAEELLQVFVLYFVQMKLCTMKVSSEVH